jgi:putative transcriptional regulator
MLSLRINEILREQGKTPYWLSKQTGISPNNIGKICNGETSTIRFDTLEKICKVLNCSINELFTTDDPFMKRLIVYRDNIVRISNNNKSDTE